MKYQFTLTRDYVSSWTYIEAIREFLQNAYDFKKIDNLSDVNISFDTASGKMTIKNTNDRLDIKTLLLGYGTKSSIDNQVGGFGEGLLLALLVLTRDGLDVSVDNGDEIWTCSFEYSTEFSEEIFVVAVDKKDSNITNDLSIVISGLAKTSIAVIKNTFLGIGKKYESIETQYGELLLDPSQKGKMYVEGLPITSDDSFAYGYNFKAQYVELDRDRKQINHDNLKTITSLAISHMEQYDFDVVDKLIENGKIDVDKIVSKSIDVPDEFTYGYSDYLKRKHDIHENDVVVNKTSDTIIEELKHAGENVVTVNKKILEDIINVTAPYSYNKVQEARDKVESRTRVDRAFERYEYSDYKKLREWLIKYKNELSTQALSDFNEILYDLEPFDFDLIKDKIVGGK